MKWGRGGIVDELRAARKELRAVKEERDALAERLDECGQLLGTVIGAGSLAPGESLVDPPEHAAVDAILRVIAERDYHCKTLRQLVGSSLSAMYLSLHNERILRERAPWLFEQLEEQQHEQDA